MIRLKTLTELPYTAHGKPADKALLIGDYRPTTDLSITPATVWTLCQSDTQIVIRIIKYQD